MNRIASRESSNIMMPTRAIDIGSYRHNYCSMPVECCWFAPGGIPQEDEMHESRNRSEKIDSYAPQEDALVRSDVMVYDTDNFPPRKEGGSLCETRANIIAASSG